MENASKALIIAGGVLIAMITISVFYYMYGHISEFSDITQDDTTQKELIAFNESFTAYQRKVMYGSDVISVINKAIDNNKKYDIENENKNNNIYYVDISFRLINEDLSTRIDYYRKEDNGYSKYKTEKRKAGDKYFELSKNKIYSIKKQYDFKSNNGTINKLLDAVQDNANVNKSSENQITLENGKKTTGYTITYYPGAEFKRKMFRCEEVKYHEENGRVSSMYFEEIEQRETT